MKNELSVFLYWPNIVGYLRVALLLYGLGMSWSSPLIAAVCFIVNLILDAVDGFLARFLNQVSVFGSILDYTIDRISFASYAVLLGTIYPQYMFLFILSLNLDLASHFFHLKASEGRASHKDVSKSESLLLRLYYKKFILGLSCLMHDLFFIFLFLYFFYPSFALQMGLFITVFGVLFKTVVHAAQIIRASRYLLDSPKKSLDLKAAEGPSDQC
ncbi:MAG: CDP-alcohol phosphatidyltransferase family protein [Rhabdochlamydiaceae bacterium]|nr:CDP-alcohol phosphatidyltransferase family protein [Rhabdochlamydiaceae bacterium]